MWSLVVAAMVGMWNVQGNAAIPGEAYEEAYEEAYVVPKHSLSCTLQAVASKMQLALRAEIPEPWLILKSGTTLQEFQTAVERQWGFKPDVVTNVYIHSINTIYLANDASFYGGANGRTLDESVAHELAHYLQVKYRGDLQDSQSERLEMEAIEIQRWFRETYMKAGLSPCLSIAAPTRLAW